MIGIEGVNEYPEEFIHIKRNVAIILNTFTARLTF